MVANLTRDSNAQPLVRLGAPPRSAPPIRLRPIRGPEKGPHPGRLGPPAPHPPPPAFQQRQVGPLPPPAPGRPRRISPPPPLPPHRIPRPSRLHRTPQQR